GCFAPTWGGWTLARVLTVGRKGLPPPPMHIPYFMPRVTRVFPNPVLGTFAWLVPPLAVVHHLGRKSGRSYKTPIVAFRSAAGFVIPMTYGTDVDWARNIVAARGCTLDRLGHHFRLRNPRIVNLEASEHPLPV